jgi:hypothetical protein
VCESESKWERRGGGEREKERGKQIDRQTEGGMEGGGVCILSYYAYANL